MREPSVFITAAYSDTGITFTQRRSTIGERRSRGGLLVNPDICLERLLDNAETLADVEPAGNA